MSRLWPLVLALGIALAGAGSFPSAAAADGTPLWAFAADTAGFHSSPSNGASNALSLVGERDFPYPPGGGLRIDYSGSRGMNASVSTSAIPPAAWDNVVTISADVYVPDQAAIAPIGLGIQIDGAPTGDVPVQLINTRGSWFHLRWPVHAGQLSGQHSFAFVLDTNDPMPAPIVIANLRAVQPTITVDATKVTGSIDAVSLWGNNIAYYYPPSFLTDPNVASMAKDAGFLSFRIPGGLNTDVYHWNGNGVRRPDGSINPAARNRDGTWRIDYSGWAPGFEVKGEGVTGDPKPTDYPVFVNLNVYDHSPPVDVTQLARWVMSLGPQAQLIVDVNVGSASSMGASGPNNTLTEADVMPGAIEAKEWVRYFNQKLGLHVKYWEIGNELNPFGAEVGSHIRDRSARGWHWITAHDYATIFRVYARQMKLVDPGIKVAGPVGFIGAPGDGSWRGNWMRSFLQEAGDVVDVMDMHFYDSGQTEAEYLAVPSNLETQVDHLRAWIQELAPARAGQIGVAVSEWGDYNNLYPVGDGLFAADLMGQMAKSQLTFANAWDIGNMIPNNGSLVPMFGFNPGQTSAGWFASATNGASMTASWQAPPGSTRVSLAVDYSGSTGANAGLGRDMQAAGRGASAGTRSSGVDWSAVDGIRADVFIPQEKGNGAISFWLRIENVDGSIDDGYHDQPLSAVWGRWNRLVFPVDPTRLARARRLDIVVSSPVAIGTPLYFGQIEAQKTLRQPNARYWAAYMYHHYFGQAVLATSIGDVSRDRLAAYGSRAQDGSLYLMVINKDPVADFTSPIAVGGSGIASLAEAYTWSGDNYVWDGAQAVATQDTPPTMKIVPSGAQFIYTFPRYSITALHLYPR